MTQIIPDRDKQKLKEILEQELTGDVNIAVLTQPGSAGLIVPGMPQRAYAETEQLLREVAELSPKVKLQVFNVQAEPQRLEEYSVAETPAIVFGVDGKRNLRYFGFPGGGEFSALLRDMVRVSQKDSEVDEKARPMVDALPPIHVEVFVTPT
ncbi:MAG: hypothetical protein HY261_11365 [Chloroflexi bacterium]|nr:hypothetical protein [Chloroflexota bacterium]